MRKKILCLMVAAVVAAVTCVTATAAVTISPHIFVNSYDPDVDYTAEMQKCVENGSQYALEVGVIYEAQRNMKIEDMGLTQYQKTNYFTTYSTAADIKAAMEEANKPVVEQPSYTEEDLYWLSHVLFAEAGCDWFPDWVQRDVASVVLNRVADPRYPNTIKGVIFDPGQYSCVDSGSSYREPTSKCIANARYVLENGSTLPPEIIGQSAYAWGPVYKTYTDPILGTTIKFFSC